MRLVLVLLQLLLAHALAVPGLAAPDTHRLGTLPREALAEMIVPPYSLGDPIGEDGVWSLLNSGGTQAGYVFQTEPLAPLPGFSGAPIDMLVTLDLAGRFIDVRLVSQNEPIFVSGLGEAPLRGFLEQYGGLSIADSLVVGTPYGAAGAGSSLVYLDGVTKATASVRIAHESILAAALKVAREKMQGIASAPPSRPDPDHVEALTWDDLVAQDIVTHAVVRNAELNARFADTIWSHDDPEARAAPDAAFLDLWMVDLGPPSIARAALSEETLAELGRFAEIAPHDEPILLIESARHGLVGEDFVRNTAPDLLSAHQGGLPVALRDSDIFVELAPGMPEGRAMILRADRRLGFDPSAEWTLNVLALREHGMLRPEIGSASFEIAHATPERFFERPAQPVAQSPWREALRARTADLGLLALLLATLFAALWPGLRRTASAEVLTPFRLSALVLVTGFVGWWGQGQLSIVTVLGVIRTAIEGGSFAFLLYDPFGLAVWGAAILGFVIWGRALFCGWLCPFGALQEFAHHAGRLLRLPQIRPSATWDRRLKSLKYIALAGLVLLVILAPDHVDKAAEIEPFKTAITTFFLREWYYVAYAAFWLLLGTVLFKGFCRYLCPLGAVMAIGGLLRGRDWIARRAPCGSPCQLCRVKCAYGAIEKSGHVNYSECFGCLDCVSIHDDPARCVPLVLDARRPSRARSAAPLIAE
ncbi:4Fe-4S binding protein [Limimaricola cinnabarinus]|uniref:Nitrous oxide reductase maturation protein NosR n=1 Tax=Limimaricola cinnabarinus LL-001 TaxID=1337093 RepID=U3AG00_9RHOB|nr:4Fe-4S binding protein [Limimaricola cinnabarinus]GAD56619.1 nitrous oxide reductase maturation protein NosR [Limimaricola cinnabarinus LL-001]